MRKIPICSVTELKNILTTFYGIDFGDDRILGITRIRDSLLDKYETITIIDKNEIERLRYRNPDYDFLYDDIIECMEFEVLPYQFVLHLG
jgi:hypothetical protein